MMQKNVNRDSSSRYRFTEDVLVSRSATRRSPSVRNNSQRTTNTVFIPYRYFENKRYKFMNKYIAYNNYYLLSIINTRKNRTISSALISKSDLDKVSGYHWTLSGNHITTKINNKSCSLGQLLGNRSHRNYGQIGKLHIYDYRRGKIRYSINQYSAVDNDTMLLEIGRHSDGRCIRVLFDREDLEILRCHVWRAEEDGKGVLEVMTNLNGNIKFMHRFIMEHNGERPRRRQFRNIRADGNQFDFSKANLIMKMTNYYNLIDESTYELVINSVHNKVYVLIDAADYEKVSSHTWTYKKRRNGGFIIWNDKHKSLPKYLLGIDNSVRIYLDLKKDEKGRLDLRNEALQRSIAGNTYIHQNKKNTFELNVITKDGQIYRALLDIDDLERVKKYTWYFEEKERRFRCREHTLHRYILASVGKMTRPKPDNEGVYDFRKKSLEKNNRNEETQK